MYKVEAHIVMDPDVTAVRLMATCPDDYTADLVRESLEYRRSKMFPGDESVTYTITEV